MLGKWHCACATRKGAADPDSRGKTALAEIAFRLEVRPANTLGWLEDLNVGFLLWFYTDASQHFFIEFPPLCSIYEVRASLVSELN